MNFEIKANVGARFKLVKRKKQPDGSEKITGKTGWFLNLVTDAGLAHLSGSDPANMFGYLSVGSGNSTPTVSDTQLQARIASTNGLTPTQPSFVKQLTTEPFYFAARRSFRFQEGVAAGIVAEVCLGKNSNGTGIFNRALIRDNSGNISTITVLSDEILDVLVEIRLYVDSSVSGSFPLKDKVGSTIRTVNYTGKPYSVWSNDVDLHWRYLNFDYLINPPPVQVFSTAMSAGYTTPPTGGAVGAPYNTGSSITRQNPTSTSAKYLIKFGVLDANASHKTICLGFNSLLTTYAFVGYQFEFDTPVVKTNQDTLTYTITMVWDRYVA